LQVADPGEMRTRLRHEGVVSTLDAQAAALRPYVPEPVLRGVTEAFQISYGSLSEAAKRTARLIAFLGAAPLPGPLMNHICPAVGVADVRVALVAHSLVAPSAAADDSVALYGTMHRVVAAFLRSQSHDPLNEVSDALRAINRCALS